MPNVVARKSIAAKYCRDERWDIFGRLIQLVCGEYEEKTNRMVLLSPSVLAKALISAGARKMEVQLISGKPERYQIRDLARIGFPYVTLTAYDDGSVVVQPTKEDYGTQRLVHQD
jgi:hypothetical protein